MPTSKKSARKTTPKKKTGRGGAKVKGKGKTLSQRKGDCAEYLVDKHLKKEGWKPLINGHLLTNKQGHGLDHIKVKYGRVLIAETKANSARLSKSQKKGGAAYLKRQLKELNAGYKGRGRYKSIKGNKAAKKAIKRLENALKKKTVEYQRFQVKLKEDEKNRKRKTGEAYDHKKDKKRCKAKKKIAPKPWKAKRKTSK